ncbi:F-box protein CPR30-like [Olea europaea var. sylvestris]|uniref:F-box protein CPR30-like n=1 Tax=Olea europaea var. sylvestris TaxID=158386 RepID=UPI000C1D31ED|nr:F-box protein CPR30-like [Olea europaea var. sylvestris]
MAYNTNRYFPECVLYEVFSWLPPKFVGRFTIVNKSSYEFIKSPAFISTHLSRCVDDDRRDYALLMPNPWFGPYWYEPCKVLCNWNVEYQVEWPAKFDFFSRPIGSFNGIVCFTNNHVRCCGRVLYLWNPILEKFKCIKSTSFNILYDSGYRFQYNVGFWYDNINDDYKLLRILQVFSILEVKQCQVEIFSLKARSWKRLSDVEVPPLFVKSDIPLVANGRINWLVIPPFRLEGDVFIFSFDTRTETFHQVTLPHFEQPLARFPDLIVYRGVLALVVVPRDVLTDWSVWVMTQFGVAETWQEIIVRTRERPLYVKFAKKENIIFGCNDSRLAVCNIEKQQTRYLEDVSRDGLWVDYHETISFLGDEDEVLE